MKEMANSKAKAIMLVLLKLIIKNGIDLVISML